jgi:hypothetical protein
MSAAYSFSQHRVGLYSWRLQRERATTYEDQSTLEYNELVRTNLEGTFQLRILSHRFRHGKGIDLVSQHDGSRLCRAVNE